MRVAVWERGGVTEPAGVQRYGKVAVKVVAVFRSRLRSIRIFFFIICCKVENIFCRSGDDSV